MTISVVQTEQAGSGNVTGTSPFNGTWWSLPSATAAGNAVLFSAAYYTTAYLGSGISSCYLATSGKTMTQIAHVPFNGSSGIGSTNYGWLDCWAAFDVPGGDTNVHTVLDFNSSFEWVAVESLWEVGGLGPDPYIDVLASGNSGASSGGTASFSSGSQETRLADELWIGAVAGWYGPSATAPAITPPGSPWANLAQQSFQIGSYSSSVNMIAGYQVASAAGPASYAGSFAADETWGAFTLTLSPVRPAGSGLLLGSMV